MIVPLRVAVRGPGAIPVPWSNVFQQTARRARSAARVPTRHQWLA